MAKAMIFIDGSWLYANQFNLSQKYGSSYRMDYGKLPKMLGEIISENLGGTNVDIVRTYLFGSNAINYDYEDDQLVMNRKDFYDLLKEEYHYEVEVFNIDYRGRRLRKADRDINDDFYPQEKCVDIALATYALYYAAIPYAYDIAIAVIGDRDFIPMLQHVRKLGKRVAIASIKESCAFDYSDPKDEKRVKDFDIIWIDDLLDRLELKLTKRRVECQSHLHVGNRTVYTDEFIRKGRHYYCAECREKLRVQKQEQMKFIESSEANANAFGGNNGTKLLGEIKKIICKRTEEGENKFGFIKTDVGDFYFHSSDLISSIDFENLKEGNRVKFNVEIHPNPRSLDKSNGKAINVELEM